MMLGSLKLQCIAIATFPGLPEFTVRHTVQLCIAFLVGCKYLNTV